jgi:predicted Zn finger-like uncharacterized protein
MDVRCEKCQTEYELDEARLKPSGVTVKCTNCGHMFKIRKRANTNVGAPAMSDAARTRPPSAPQQSGDRVFTDETVVTGKVGEAPAAERQWLIRLENGEQKSCRELASLQQWIVAGIVTRESLISRTGKTWKRLGDIGELAQYFTVADETRAHRTTKPSAPTPPAPPPPSAPVKKEDLRATMLGVGTRPASPPPPPPSSAAMLDDDDVEDDDEVVGRRTGAFAAALGDRAAAKPPAAPLRTPATGIPSVTRTPPAGAPSAAPPPPPSRTLVPAAPQQLKTPPAGVPVKPATPPLNARPPTPPPPPPLASSTIASMSPPPVLAATSPPPPPAPTKKPTMAPQPVPAPPVVATAPPMHAPPVPTGNRATANWATDGIQPKGDATKGPSGPLGGKITAISDEPAFAGSFAGRVRTEPTDASVFSSGKVRAIDDDDDALPPRRGSRAGTWIALIAIVVIGGSAATIFAMMHKDKERQAANKPADAGVAAISVDAAVVAMVPDAAVGSATVTPLAPFSAQRTELLSDVEGRLLPSLQAIAGQDDAASLAMRAHLGAQIAQDLRDRGGLLDKAEGDKLRAESDKLVVDAASLAPRALKAAPGDPTANLAMAEVLRLQKKPARDIKRYLDAARGKLDVKADPQLAREIALADALDLARDGKLDDARTAFSSIDQGEGKLETSGDVRARFHIALVLQAQGKAADAKPLVDQILAAQPEHAGARALSDRLGTTVATADPLPPEDHGSEHKDAGVAPAVKPDAATVAAVKPDAATAPKNNGNDNPPPPTGGGDYAHLVAQANKIAESNCAAAIKLYQQALDGNPAGTDALAGIGYCQLDAKQFSSAYSKFSAALAVDPHNESALAGIAEMYQQQGKKDRAIEAWKNYQAVFPGSAKAQKQLDRLGANAEQPAPTPTPAPEAPAPAPTPAPAN